MFLLQRLYSVSKPKKGTQSVPHGISTSLFALFIQQGKWHQLGTSLTLNILKQRQIDKERQSKKLQYFRIKYNERRKIQVVDIPLTSTTVHMDTFGICIPILKITFILFVFNKRLISTCCGPKLQPCLIRSLAQMLCSFSASFSTSPS